jgi:hydrogenase 3 maturation protease
MSISSWQKQLRQIITHLAQNKLSPRIAIVGIGNQLNGDDAFGPRVVQALQAWQAHSTSLHPLLLVQADQAPENFTGKLRQFSPDLVILVDSAQIGAPPGEIAWLPWEDTAVLSASTHTLPISVFSSYLYRELGSRVVLLAVQGLHFEVGQPLSKPLFLAKNRIVRTLKSIM